MTTVEHPISNWPKTSNSNKDDYMNLRRLLVEFNNKQLEFWIDNASDKVIIIPETDGWQWSKNLFRAELEEFLKTTLNQETGFEITYQD